MSDLVSKSKAREMAILYRSFCEAVRTEDPIEKLSCGKVLIDMQNETGLILLDEVVIREIVKSATEEIVNCND